MLSISLPFCRGTRPFISLPAKVHLPPHSLARASSLSAIHRGIHESEKARPQGYNFGREADSSRSGRPQTYAERRQARLDAKPTFKIRKGKKNIAASPLELKPKSRRARFNDPEDNFGKRSLVYQLKSGQLRAELEASEKRDTAKTRSGSQDRETETSFRDRLFQNDGQSSSRSAGKPSARPSMRLPPRSPRSDRSGRLGRRDPRPSETPWGGRGGHRGLRSSYASETPRGGYRGRDESTFRRRRESRDEESTDGPRRSSSFSRPIMTVRSIPYTTAASQFLYGRSVVEGALKASKRKLYHLYIYGGANRRNVGQDMTIEKLAKKKGVKVTILGERDQDLMAKMSQGRPHNGYILEASPVPQLPVTGLGPLAGPEDTRTGFTVSLAHQSAEDKAVNGTDSFITTAPGKKHKPLVLVLDQIRDPGNLGAILRSASFLGVSAVAISKGNSATMTSVALKASAGASETIPVFSLESTASFLTNSREAGWMVYAAVASHSSARRYTQVDMHDVEELDPLQNDPCILLIGSEGEGLPRMLKSKSDFEVNIPNESDSDAVDSLNVSVATGLLCSAFMKGQAKLSSFRPPRRPQKSDELGLW